MQNFILQLGGKAKNCLIYPENQHTIHIYELGFKTFHPSPHFVFIDGNYVKSPCDFCINRIKQKMNYCAIEDFCNGFKPIQPKHFFRLKSLLLFLKNNSYTITKTYEGGYTCQNNKKYTIFLTTI